MTTAVLMSILVFTWLGVVGACIGSFLNVVIYRLPAGKSIVSPPSSCPKCAKQIRSYHNLPVLGWLVLRGRCYDCKTPISARYPLVELLVGGAFFVLGLSIFSQSDGPPQSLFEYQLWAAFVGLAGLFSCLLAALLIRYDGHRIPRGIWLATALFAATLVASVWIP